METIPGNWAGMGENNNNLKKGSATSTREPALIPQTTHSLFFFIPSDAQGLELSLLMSQE